MSIPIPELPGRALTPELKRVIVDRVLVAWEAQPQLRLGQLIVNTIHRITGGATKEEQVQRLYYLEDATLADLLQRDANAMPRVTGEPCLEQGLITRQRAAELVAEGMQEAAQNAERAILTEMGEL